MIYSAVIVAAGLSSRMGNFKPLLPLGDETFITRLVSTFQQAGVAEIIVVSGYRSEELAPALSNYSVRLVQNEAYASTEMFDSILLGLGACSKSSGYLVTCVDAPLFKPETVRAIIEVFEEGASVVVPVYQGCGGHPVLLSAEALEVVMRYKGSGGLRSVLCDLELSGSYESVEVDDIGVLLQANTPEEYQALLEHYSALERRTEGSLAN